jgi:hypothetical protein
LRRIFRWADDSARAERGQRGIIDRRLIGDDQAQACGAGIDADEIGGAAERRDKGFAACGPRGLGRGFGNLSLFASRRRKVETADEEAEQAVIKCSIDGADREQQPAAGSRGCSSAHSRTAPPKSRSRA